MKYDPHQTISELGNSLRDLGSDAEACLNILQGQVQYPEAGRRLMIERLKRHIPVAKATLSRAFPRLVVTEDAPERIKEMNLGRETT